MITDERTSSYIDSLWSGNTPFLDELEKNCIENDIPIIRRSMQSLLKYILQSNKPKRILEVGAAVGFSAILMAEYSDDDAHITTIEKYEKRIPIARDNFKMSGYDHKITFFAEDASDVLKRLREENQKFDLIFMDAAKGQYMNFFEDVMGLMEEGSILVSDNVLQDGDIIQSRFAVTRRNRTIHSRMREYLKTLTEDTRLTTTVLPVGDGVTLSVRRGAK